MKASAFVTCETSLLILIRTLILAASAADATGLGLNMANLCGVGKATTCSISRIISPAKTENRHGNQRKSVVRDLGNRTNLLLRANLKFQ